MIIAQATYYVTSCDDYTWNGTGYTASGTYTFDHTLPGSPCTNVDTLHLTINSSTHNSYHQDACEQYTWHDVNYNESGNYTYDYTNDDNCPSTDTLHLSISQHHDSTYYVTACDEYSWNSISYTASGTYTFDNTLPESPCTDVDTLHLTINHSSHDVFLQDACDQYVWHDVVYIESGTYTYDYTNGEGCPGADTLHLVLHYSSWGAEWQTACDTFRWAANGRLYSTSAVDTARLLNQWLCDSLAVLHLSLSPSYHTDTLVTGCDSLQWEGISYTADTTLTDSLTTTAGCDSITVVRLHVAPRPQAAMALSADFLTEETPTLTAADISHGPHQRQWYVNAHPYDTTPAITYRADLTEDSVRIALAVATEGCTDSTTRSIPFRHEELYVPNVFSPKGREEENSRFGVRGATVDYELRIYSRKGTLVFGSKDPSEQWDGTHKGAPCPQGTYLYVISYTTPAAPTVPKRKTGSVVLLR